MNSLTQLGIIGLVFGLMEPDNIPDGSFWCDASVFERIKVMGCSYEHREPIRSRSQKKQRKRKRQGIGR